MNTLLRAIRESTEKGSTITLDPLEELLSEEELEVLRVWITPWLYGTGPRLEEREAVIGVEAVAAWSIPSKVTVDSVRVRTSSGSHKILSTVPVVRLRKGDNLTVHIALGVI